MTTALVVTVLPGLAAAGAGAAHAAGTPVEVPSGPSDLSVSADGRWIAFAGDEGGSSGLYRYDPVSGQAWRLASVDGAVVAETSISGDGRFIAWARRTAARGQGWDPSSQVYVTDAEAGTTWLVSGDRVDGSAGNEGSAQPQVSDDGSHVVFTTRATDVVEGPYAAAPGSDVVVASLGAQGPSQPRLVSAEEAGVDFSEPTVDADADRIAFTRSSVGGSRIVLADRAAGGPASLAEVAVGSAPALSADGSSLALVRTQSQPGGVVRSATYVRTLATGSEVQADVEDKGWPLRGDSAAPVLDRDGGSVLFALAGAEGTELVERDVDLGTTRVLARGVDPSAGHDLSTDGAHVVHVGDGAVWVVDVDRPSEVGAPNAMWNPLVQRASTPARGRGYVLRVDPAVWEPLRTSRVERQWLRNGRPIRGATGLTYEITAADLGREIKVRERLRVPGLPVGVATSRGYKVKPDLARLLAPARLRVGAARVTLRVRVRTLPGSETYVKGAAAPQGTVRVVVGRRVLHATVGRDGWARLMLPRMRPGRHQLRVQHVGTAYVRAAAPKRVSLLVRQRR
ncbi:TolB family protein [Nocardioides daphniae]|uniref:Bacterial Ig-like domain-containing protein n=1 Tax=Nocardioides daphniae TaxID=402297 RepID=A0ABQ1Q4U8_9ACTN|nr:PD40 domain-containing protein [Nocardioides daphniae]GGD13994.1 hypothetical protein GCM10007231_11320 [Nocardioides daphniae]